MGDWLVWLLLGSFIIVLFCIYSLSSQVERCVQLAVEIITGNQRKILEQVEALNRIRDAVPFSPSNVVPFERRVRQRRHATEDRTGAANRRRLPGRRRQDLLQTEDLLQTRQ